MGIPRLRLRIETVEALPRDGSYGKEVLGCFIQFFCLFYIFHGGPLAMKGYHESQDVAALVAFVVGAAAVLLYCAIFDKRIHGIFGKLKHVYIASGVFSASMLALVGLSCLSLPVSFILETLAMLVLGASDALLVFYWAIAFSRMEPNRAVRAASIGSATAVAIFWAAHAFVPDIVLALVCTLAPLANLVLLRDRVTTRLPNIELREAVYFNELNIDRLAFAGRLAPMAFSFGCILGVLLGSSIWSASSLGRASSLPWPFVGCFASVAIGLYIAYRMEFTDAHFHKYFRSMLPVVGLLILPLPYASADAPGLVVFSLSMALAMCIGLFWSFCACLSQRFRLSPVFTFGISMGCLTIGTALTHFLSYMLMLFYGSQIPGWAVGIILSLFALVVLCAYFPSPIDITDIVKKSYDFEAGHCSLESEELPVQDVSEIAPQELLDDEELAGQRKGRFLRKCDAASGIFLLSGRESEVLVLLAKGRNAGFIKDALCISEGTAKTHVHHVYKKLGVHSQQELIALVESLDVE